MGMLPCRSVPAHQAAGSARRAAAVVAIALALGIRLTAASPAAVDDRPPAGPVTPAERSAIRERILALEARLVAMQAAGLDADRAADARLFLEAVQRVVDYEPAIDAGGRGQIEAALEAGATRVAALEAGRHPWTALPGRSLRGFRSAVDGSTEPYVDRKSVV